MNIGMFQLKCALPGLMGLLLILLNLLLQRVDLIIRITITCAGIAGCRATNGCFCSGRSPHQLVWQLDLHLDVIGGCGDENITPQPIR